MNGNGDGSGTIKMLAQDVAIVPACAFQMPAAAVIRLLRSVDGCLRLSNGIISFQDGLPAISMAGALDFSDEL